MKRTTNSAHEIPAAEQAQLAQRIQAGEAGNTPGGLASQPQVHVVPAARSSDMGAPANRDDNGQPAATVPTWKSAGSEETGHCATTLQLLAAQGDPDAQIKLGQMYYHGTDIPQDLGKAFAWFEKSAEQGTAWAQAALGSMLYLGMGVKLDFKLAFAWCSKAAAQNNAAGEFYLAEMYIAGKGVGKDIAKALELCEKSANRGFAHAQVALGRMYYFGIGVGQDYRLAIKWYSAAAAQGKGRPAFQLGEMYRTGEGVELDLTKAFDWFMKSAKQGDVDGQTSLAEMYASGQGVEQNSAEAMHWLCQSRTIKNELLLPFTPHCNALLRHLEKELNERPYVTSLIIANQQLDSSGAQSIARLIENNRTLKRLIFLNTWINSIGVQAIMAAVRRNTTLEAIDATGNPGFSNEMRVEIAQCVQRNTQSALLIAKYVDEHPINISDPLPPEVCSLIQHALILAHQGKANPLTGALLYPTMQATEERILEFSYASAYDAITRQQTGLRL